MKNNIPDNATPRDLYEMAQRQSCWDENSLKRFMHHRNAYPELKVWAVTALKEGPGTYKVPQVPEGFIPTPVPDTQPANPAPQADTYPAPKPQPGFARPAPIPQPDPTSEVKPGLTPIPVSTLSSVVRAEWAGPHMMDKPESPVDSEQYSGQFTHHTIEGNENEEKYMEPSSLLIESHDVELERIEGRDWKKTIIFLGVALAALIAIGISAWMVFFHPTTPGSSPTVTDKPTPTQPRTTATRPQTPDKNDVPSHLSVSGDKYTCNVVKDGVECVGSNTHGQLGIPQGDSHYNKIPMKKVVLLAGGQDFVCASTGKGVTCWGDNRWSQAGQQPNSHVEPTAVKKLEGKKIVSLSAGVVHACAITQDEGTSLWCWGSDYAGQLGSGKQGDKATGAREVHLPNSRQPVRVMATDFGTCVVDDKDALWCWGSNDSKTFTNGDEPIVGITLMTPPDTSTSSPSPIERDSVSDVHKNAGSS